MRRNQNKTVASSQRGISLVELLIAISLGLFLTWGATQAYLVGKQTYSMQQALSRIQENGRMVHELMAYEVRNAGSIGCVSRMLMENSSTGTGCSSGVSMLNSPNSVEYNFGNIVYGINDADGSPTSGQPFAGTGGLSPAPKAQTDVLLVRGISSTAATQLSGNTTGNGSGSFPVMLNAAPDGSGCVDGGICNNDILVLSDCVKAKIFQVTNVGGGAAFAHAVSARNQCSQWTGTVPFMAGAQVAKMYNNFYYVANNVAGRPALYMAGLDGVGTELLEGVEDMQIEYGVGKEDQTPCTDASQLGTGYEIDQYKTADQVTAQEWSAWDELLCDTATPRRAVVAVRYSLLVRSEDWVLDAPQHYNFNGVDYVGGVQGTVATAASDRRLRQIFTTTVSIRNQVK